MKLELDIEEILTPEEIKLVAKSVLEQKLKANYERVLSNSAYRVVWDAVDEVLDNKAKEMVRDNVLKIIEEMSAFVVFRSSNGWGDMDSDALQIVKQTVHDNEELIKSKVLGHIEKYNYAQRLQECEDGYIQDVLISALKKGLNGEL